MTSTINFVDLANKMTILKEMHASPTNTKTERKRYVELRKEISSLLVPLFMDLNETDMLLLWTKRDDGTSSLDTLEFNGLNSAMQMSIKD